MTRISCTRRMALACLASAAVTGPAFAQSWPARPLRLIVPASAGSGPDVVARLLGDRLGARLGQPVMVEAIPGAAGILGADKALNAAADGYTFLFGFNQLMTMNPHLYARLPYDPVHGVAPVSLIAKGGYVLLASPDAPFQDVQGLVANSRLRQLAYASTGNGSAAHLGMELLKQRAGIDLLHVPYRAGGAANTDLMAGRVQVKIEPQSSAVPLVRAGKVKAIAVTTSTRLAALPGVPTMAETFPGFVVTGWNAVWAPAGVPAPIVQRMSREIQEMLQEPELRKRLSDMGIEPESSTPDALAELTAQESVQWGRLIRDKGIKAD